MAVDNIGEPEEHQNERQQERRADGINQAEQEIQLYLWFRGVESDAPRIHCRFSIRLGLHQEKVLQVVYYQRFQPQDFPSDARPPVNHDVSYEEGCFQGNGLPNGDRNPAETRQKRTGQISERDYS